MHAYPTGVTPIQKIVLYVAFSVCATLVPMAIMSQMPGLDIQFPYWVFAILCSSSVSATVSVILVRQSERLARVYAELSQAHDALKRVAERDQLTDVLNRSSFLERIEIARDRHGFIDGWLLLLDVDHFKSVNDSHGHETGDRALQRVAAILRGSIRDGDLVGRLGGEEFGIYLPRATRFAALQIAERARRGVAGSRVLSPTGREVTVTVSIGLSEHRGGAEVRKSLRRADLALYDAKNGGRNMVRLAA